VTVGIVSARAATSSRNASFQSFIQTDRGHQPGKLRGRWLTWMETSSAINTAIFTSRRDTRCGLAMPGRTPAHVYNKLISPDHKVTRGSIGIEFNAQPKPGDRAPFTAKLRRYRCQRSSGGPADQAGLKTGDAITEVNGKKVANGNELVGEISNLAPGYKSEDLVSAHGKPGETSVTIADRGQALSTIVCDEDDSNSQDQPTESKLGITVPRSPATG